MVITIVGALRLVTKFITVDNPISAEGDMTGSKFAFVVTDDAVTLTIATAFRLLVAIVTIFPFFGGNDPISAAFGLTRLTIAPAITDFAACVVGAGLGDLVAIITRFTEGFVDIAIAAKALGEAVIDDGPALFDD